METSEDKQWASKYLLDPLNAPEPSDETGPGTHFNSTFAQAKEEDKGPEATVTELGADPTPARAAQAGQSRFSQSTETADEQHVRRSVRESSEIPTSSNRTSLDHRRHRRGTSLSERYAGDESHKPLDIIRRESLRANRSPHLRRDRHHGLDTIDKLGDIGDGFHHEGPYDAVSLARNKNNRGAPVAALMGSNSEALKATPRAYLYDSLRHHRPLEGVATIPPGVPDVLTGEVYNYREGTDMQRDTDRNYLNRWQGVDYHPDDRKGKGEPSFSLDRALNGPKHSRYLSESGIEMKQSPRRSMDGSAPATRMRASSGAVAASGTDQSYSEWESGLRRSSSARGSRLASKFGSLTRRNRPGGGN